LQPHRALEVAEERFRLFDVGTSPGSLLGEAMETGDDEDAALDV